jgi:hypothetical protein
VSWLCAIPALAISKDPLAVDLPALEIMPQAQWYWVGQHMAVNEVPMAIKMFTYRGKGEDVAAFYRSLWKGKGHGKLSERAMGQRMILGYELDGFYYTIQYEESGGVVQGKAVVTPTPLNYKSSKKTQLPLPPRAKVYSKVESLDLGKREETLSLETSFDVSYVTDFYKRELGLDGWHLFSASGDLRKSAVMSFQRGGELLQLTAKALQHSNSHGTQLLIHWLK